MNESIQCDAVRWEQFCVYVVFTALTWYTVMKTVFKTKNMKIHFVQNNAKLTQPQTLENYA